jgi:hypothetical protein
MKDAAQRDAAVFPFGDDIPRTTSKGVFWDVLFQQKAI